MFQIAFVDLDDTLFSSLHKQGECSALEPAALLRDGSTISYTSPEQRAMSRWLDESDLVIPVTARTAEAFRRVLLRFDNFAVVSHGATILNDDHQVNADWMRRVDEGLQKELPSLRELENQLKAQFGDLNIRLAGERDRPAYLMVKDAGKDSEKVRIAYEKGVCSWLSEHGGFVGHLNGNNLAVLPPSVSKKAAVSYLIEMLRKRHGEELFIVGAGDSLTDTPFLSLCHAVLIPTRSQVWKAVCALPLVTEGASQ